MSSYTVIAGDTYDLVSRKVYGEESEALRLKEANPGVAEPLAPGVVLFIPANQFAAQIVAGGTDPELVELLIDGERFKFWESIVIRRAIDTPDAIGFSAPFTPEDASFRETFRPFSFSPLSVLVGGAKLFTGTLIDVTPEVSTDRKAVHVSGYSRPGVLFDCTAPASSFPLEYDNQTVIQTATALALPFGIGAVEQGEGGPKFERVALAPGKKVGEFIAGLAKQRGQVLSSTVEGELLVWESVDTGNPVAILAEGSSPLESVTPQFKTQEYFSDITGLSLVWLTSVDEKYTVRNNFAPGVLRPHTFEVKDIQAGSVKKAGEAKLGRMFGQVASYTVELASWRTPKGELWEPNTTMQLEAPGAMIYSPYEFLIKAVTFKRVKDRETATLELVLPGAYNGKQPESLPWQG